MKSAAFLDGLGREEEDRPLEQSCDCLQNGSSLTGRVFQPQVLRDESDEPLKAARPHELVFRNAGGIEAAVLEFVEEWQEDSADQRCSSRG
jgi:hypothetical protein